MGLIRRLPLEAGIEVVLPATVLLFACGSSSVPAVTRIGAPTRWAALLALAGLALLAAVIRRRALRSFPPAWTLATVFVGYCAAAAGWSVDPRLTFGRGFTVGVLFVASAALTRCWATTSDAATRVMRGVLTGIALVALAGVVVLVVARHDAVLSATLGSGWRFRGLGENPNTVAMLLSIGLPLALWRALDGSMRERRAGAALVLLFAGEIAVSGTRGALIAGFGGAVVTALVLARSARQRVLLVSVLLLLAVACAVTPKLHGSAGQATSATQPAAGAPSHRGLDAQASFRLEDELGHPPLGAYRPPVPRTFLGSSGRVQAWVGAIHQAEKRPVLGYGFGTESKVFVDRFYAFEAAFVENSYVGLFLQVGVLGLLLFVGLLGLLAWNAFRLAARRSSVSLAQSAGLTGVLVAAALIGLTQSGLLSVGNIAASSIWLTVLMLPALAREAVLP